MEFNRRNARFFGVSRIDAESYGMARKPRSYYYGLAPLMREPFVLTTNPQCLFRFISCSLSGSLGAALFFGAVIRF